MQNLTNLENQKRQLLNEVKPLMEEKRRRFLNMDIESPKSPQEKELEKKIAKLFSQIDKIVRQINSIKSPKL